MIDLERLNAKDVLKHLHSLGYVDITAEQLRDFIHDLKKLIKYEQKQALKCHAELEQETERSPECNCPHSEDDGSSESNYSESYCESSVSSCPTSATYSQPNSKFTGSNKHSARTTIDPELMQKAHTSFIRPWNIQGCKDLSARSKKNPDPVQLYHQYKAIWKSQNIPGESKHLELRWVIRNKMLGQEPSPRVCI